MSISLKSCLVFMCLVGVTPCSLGDGDGGYKKERTNWGTSFFWCQLSYTGYGNWDCPTQGDLIAPIPIPGSSPWGCVM